MAGIKPTAAAAPERTTYHDIDEHPAPGRNVDGGLLSSLHSWALRRRWLCSVPFNNSTDSASRTGAPAVAWSLLP